MIYLGKRVCYSVTECNVDFCVLNNVDHQTA